MGFSSGLVVKNLLVTQERQETQIRSLGWEDPLEEGVETHSRILAWRIPWAEEPGGLQSMGSQSQTQLSEHAGVDGTIQMHMMCSGQQNFLVLFTLPVASSADTDFLVASASSCHRCPLPLPQAQIKRIQLPRGTMNNPAESDISHSTFQSVRSTKHRGKAF